MTIAEEPAPSHDEIDAKLSDYVEGSLGADDVRAVEQHIASCEECRASIAELRETRSALSGLNRVPAPQDFEREVAETIRRRSRGRFFGRRTFGDRVPLELLAVVVLALGFAAYLLIRSSTTGSLRYDRDPQRPRIQQGAPEVVPRP